MGICIEAAPSRERSGSSARLVHVMICMQGLHFPPSLVWARETCMHSDNTAVVTPFNKRVDVGYGNTAIRGLM
jgi:hypothetical protein